LLISPVADLSDPVSSLQGAGLQVYNSFSGWRIHSARHGEWDSHSSALGLQTQQEGVGHREDKKAKVTQEQLEE
jgi:hypothetical protein